MHGVLPILIMMVMLMLTGCSNDDDYRAPYSPDTSCDFSFTCNGTRGDVYILQEHTKGVNGFPIVIMADGYSSTDIENGEYKKAVDNAVNALIKQKPMCDLIEYLDIYSVVVVSEHSGIDYSQHDTAFKTYLESKDNTNVIGDTTKISNFTYYSLRKSSERFRNALTIMLLNSADYAGVTLMAMDTTVTDTIPQGWSLSYVPAYATAPNGANVFDELILHEAVGHGIGKLADEYWYNEKPTREDTIFYRRSRKFGFATNIKYFYNQETGDFAYPVCIYTSDNVKYYIQRKVDAEDDILAPFANDSRYASEENRWIQGGYTFITLTDAPCGEEYDLPDGSGHTKKVMPNFCKANFYRSSMSSIMGDVIYSDNLEFNTLSRLAMYKRINKVANGSGWKYDFETFVNFDKGSSMTKAANTFRMTPTTKYIIMEGSEKQLTRPKIILQ